MPKVQPQKNPRWAHQRLPLMSRQLQDPIRMASNISDPLMQIAHLEVNKIITPLSTTLVPLQRDLEIGMDK